MIGKGHGYKGAVWVAKQLPEGFNIYLNKKYGESSTSVCKLLSHIIFASYFHNCIVLLFFHDNTDSY